MDMSQGMLQNLQQQQKLVLTQEMKYSLKILQMPIHELEQDVVKELEENPLLDIVQEAEVKEERTDINEEEKAEFKELVENDENRSKEINYKQLVSDNEDSRYENVSYKSEEEEKIDPLNFIIEKKTLKDHLKEQLQELNENSKILNICAYIIENIDEKGYLGCEISEIIAEAKTTNEQVEYALELVQGFTPPGIAARDLKECLKLQLLRKGIQEEAVYTLIDEDLQLIADNKLKEISKKMNLDIKKVQEYCNIIKTLEPKPSRGFFTGNQEKYVVPEAYIKKIGKDIYILMNDNVLPRLTINQLYKDILKNEKDEQALTYVKEKLNSAVSLIKGIEHRNSTIYNILETITKIQKQYFELGEQYLKPMTIADIAGKLNLHESTISRAIRDKYISTPYKVIMIKDLFTTAIQSDMEEESISSSLVKREIKKLIEAEKKSRPLSDQDICDMLKDKNIKISRRAVAKYRDEMGIAASSKRKVYES